MSKVVPVEDIPNLKPDELWSLLRVYVENVGVPLVKDCPIPIRARIVFKTLERQLGLETPPFSTGTGHSIITGKG